VSVPNVNGEFAYANCEPATQLNWGKRKLRALYRFTWTNSANGGLLPGPNDAYYRSPQFAKENY
jgi:hypothetical protein